MHWIYPSIGRVIFGFGNSAATDTFFTIVIDAFPDVGLPVHYQTTHSTNRCANLACRQYICLRCLLSKCSEYRRTVCD